MLQRYERQGAQGARGFRRYAKADRTSIMWRMHRIKLKLGRQICPPQHDVEARRMSPAKEYFRVSGQRGNFFRGFPLNPPWSCYSNPETKISKLCHLSKLPSVSQHRAMTRVCCSSPTRDLPASETVCTRSGNDIISVCRSLLDHCLAACHFLCSTYDCSATSR